MKTKLLLSLLTVFSFFGLQAQNNYLLPNSISGLTLQLTGNSGLTGQSKQAQSFTTTTEVSWFLAPAGYDNTGTPRQYGNLTAYLRNTSNAWIKITLYQGNSTNKIKQLSIPPLFQIDEVDFCNASDNFYWKVESNTPQTPVAIADTIVAVRLTSSTIINVLHNDENIGNNYSARVKPGQTLFGSTIFSNLISRNGDLSVYLPSDATNTSFKYQILDPSDAVLTEGDVYIKVIEQPQYCILDIVSLQLAEGSKDQYILITSSPNSSTTGPYNYTIKNVSTNAIVRSGQTPNPDVIYKTISFLNLPTATYEVKITAIGKSCSATETVYHVFADDACNIKVNYISKKGTSNTYEADVTFSEITTYKWESNYGTNIGLGGNSSTKVSFTLPTNTPEGDYTFIVRNEGQKQCSFASFFNHRNLQANTGSLETYVKFITGKQDNWEIRGLNSEASGRDYTTQWRITDNRPNIIWQSYISDWQNLGQSASASASIGFQKDTARNEPAIWLSIFENRIELRQRTTKSGSVTTVNTAYGVTFPLWVRLEKTGANIVAKYSSTQSLFPIWTQIGSIANATPNWSKLLKTLSVGSGKPDVTSSARFQGHLGGTVNFGTTSTQTPAAPTIIKSIANPNQNDALTLSASNCSNGSIVKWYKNNVSAGAGSTLAIIAIHNDAYYARCENGSIRSDSSNVIRFNYTTNSCDNTTAFSISTITATTGNNYAVAYNASSSLTSVNVDIKNASNSSVRNYDTPVTANPLIIDAGVLTTGTYTLKLTGKSCTGNASKSFTINAAPPTLSCNNNGTFSISSISQSDGQLYNVTYNASNLNNVEAVIKNASSIAVRTITLSVNSNPTVVDIGNQTAGTYTLQLNGLSCIGSTTAKTFTVVDNKPSCQNQGSFSIASATYNAGSLTFDFNAANLRNATWTVRQGTTIISSGILADISSRTNTVNTTTLAAGTYTLQLEGNSCVGLAVRQFSVGTVTTSPVLASSILSPVTGDNITLTATGCTAGNYNFYKNLETIAFATNTGTLQISNVQAPDYYYVQCASGSLNSNYIQVNALVGNGSGQINFVNNTKAVPVELTLSKYNPDAFPTISVINSTDPVTGKPFPNWSISWKVEGTNFSNALRNNKTTKIGIPFMFDMLPAPYGGYGQRCIDYVYVQNPNTGQVWESDVACTGLQYNQYFGNLSHTIANFSSALPFEERAGDGGGAGLDRITEWNGISDLAYFYDQGQIGGEKFGLRDWVNGKANIGLSDYDNEGTFVTNKSLAILLGLASKSKGYVFDQYANILQGVYIDPSQYPLDFYNPNSAYPQYTQLLDETNGEPNSGGPGLQTNNVPTREFWNPAYKIEIPSKFSGQKGIVDEPTILPSVEVSCISSATFRQGETYVYNNTGSTRTVNKFGLQANTQHMIARTIFAAETHKWYCVNRLNNRKMIIQAKILCDQQQNGLLLDQNYTNTYITNTSLANKHFDREYSFDIGAFVAFTGCEWNIWDRNQMGVNLDGYHGAFGIINLLNQRKTFGSESVSFVDLKPRAKFLLWQSEISYNNGDTYVKDKANNYVMSSTKIPQRQFITPDGYWGGFLARPENTEATSCILRVSYNGQNYTHTVTPDMWETVDYAYRSTALASLPNEKKDYYYFLIKLGGIIQDGGSTRVPVINAVPSVPVAGTSVTFTATGCTGTVKWFLSDGQVSTGTSYVVANPIANNSYTATCTISGVSSGASNAITVTAAPTSGSVTIIEPSKPPYYFSDGHAPSWYDGNAHLPAIFTGTNGYDPTNEFVWLKNDKIKIGINLKRGGQLAWASLINDNANLVYNGYDGGFQVQLDAYQKKDGYQQNGKYSRAQFDAAAQYTNSTISPYPNNLTSYNVTQGGDFLNHCQTLIDYHTVGNNGYYVKLRPVFYTIDSEFSQTYIEVTYTLEGYALKIDYKYTSYRTDGQYEGSGFDSGHAPVCFLVNNLTKYKSYTGNQPWTRSDKYSDIEDGFLPNETTGQSTSGTPLTKASKEKWSLVYNPDNNKTIGIFSVSTANEETFGLKQKDIYDGNGARVGGEFGGGYTILGRNYDLVPFGTNFDRSNFSKTISSYLIVTPDTPTFIDKVYQISGH